MSKKLLIEATSEGEFLASHSVADLCESGNLQKPQTGVVCVAEVVCVFFLR